MRPSRGWHRTIEIDLLKEHLRTVAADRVALEDGAFRCLQHRDLHKYIYIFQGGFTGSIFHLQAIWSSGKRQYIVHICRDLRSTPHLSQRIHLEEGRRLSGDAHLEGRKLNVNARQSRHDEDLARTAGRSP